MKKNIINLSVFTFIFIFLHKSLFPHICIDQHFDTLTQLYANNIIKYGEPIKLHLGCGEHNFKGYVNIDFPPSEHTFQSKLHADVYADIKQLKFYPQTVDEIRLHHLFEHFERPIAFALLCNWHTWLKIGGIVHIETPDFQKAIMALNSSEYTYDEKQMILRHVFGSHEASWAIHCDGWYAERFYKTLSYLGFKNIRIVTQTRGKILFNVIVTAEKEKHLNLEELTYRAKELLRKSLVAPSEEPLLNIWMKNFREIFALGL